MNEKQIKKCFLETMKEGQASDEDFLLFENMWKNDIEFKTALILFANKIVEKSRQDGNFEERERIRKSFFDVYPKILEHRKHCSKWGKEFCLECFGNGLSNFAECLGIDTNPLMEKELKQNE